MIIIIILILANNDDEENYDDENDDDGDQEVEEDERKPVGESSVERNTYPVDELNLNIFSEKTERKKILQNFHQKEEKYIQPDTFSENSNFSFETQIKYKFLTQNFQWK